jgi:hypothetical protein
MIPDQQSLVHVMLGVLGSYSRFVTIGFISYQLFEYLTSQEPVRHTLEDFSEFLIGYSLRSLIKDQLTLN